MSRQLSAHQGHLTSAELLRRARERDASAIGALYDRYADALFRTAYRISGSRQDAEDAVHDLFVGLPDALKRYEDRGQFDAWLTRVVVRIALMRARAERGRRTSVLDNAAGVAAADRTDAQVEHSELQRAVMHLPDALRIVFVLKQVEGYSHDEIGVLLGISAGASRVRLARALAALRQSLH